MQIFVLENDAVEKFLFMAACNFFNSSPDDTNQTQKSNYCLTTHYYINGGKLNKIN